MSEQRQKRKNGAAASDSSAHKKRKEGTGGRWKTPAQKAKQAEQIVMGTALEVGDQGIWVTYARGMKGKAIREFKELCDEYGEKLYGIKPVSSEQQEAEQGEDERDIESAIQQELSDMKAPHKVKSRQTFSPVSVSIECVFFMKTMAPVDPVRLVREICQDARECPSPLQRKCRYINRLTPVVDTDKATDNGIKKVVHRVLAPLFTLRKSEETEAEPEAAAENETAAAAAVAENNDATKSEATTQTGQGTSNVSYAIRPKVRNHTIFDSCEVIKMVAAMIQPAHKVNLTDQDKVILIEIFQMFCGISVVDGREWEDLKRYNMNALYGMTAEQKSGGGGGGGGKKVRPGDDAQGSEL